MALDYTAITYGQVCAYAKLESGKTFEDLSEATGWSLTLCKRVFNEHDPYDLSASKIPTAERALGNTHISNWVAANRMAAAAPAPDALEPASLLAEVNTITAAHGAVCQSAVEAMADGRLSIVEARQLCHALLGVEDTARHLRTALGEYIHQHEGGR